MQAKWNLSWPLWFVCSMNNQWTQWGNAALFLKMVVPMFTMRTAVVCLALLLTNWWWKSRQHSWKSLFHVYKTFTTFSPNFTQFDFPNTSIGENETNENCKSFVFSGQHLTKKWPIQGFGREVCWSTTIKPIFGTERLPPFPSNEDMARYTTFWQWCQTARWGNLCLQLQAAYFFRHSLDTIKGTL